MAKLGYPFFVVAKTRKKYLALIKELEEKYGYSPNGPLHDNGHCGTHGDFGGKSAFINLNVKTYWHTMPGVSFSQVEFDRPISDKDFRKLLKIFLKNEYRKFSD